MKQVIDGDCIAVAVAIEVKLDAIILNKILLLPWPPCTAHCRVAAFAA